MKKHSVRILLLAALACAMSSASFAGIIITVVPPVLPVYTLPVCPEPGLLWTPGYWAYEDPAVGYYWVPGVWVAPPEPGLLWTPPYWGLEGAAYVLHPGYWGPHIGFYGGVDYGFWYYGTGLVRRGGGCRWVWATTAPAAWAASGLPECFGITPPSSWAFTAPDSRSSRIQPWWWPAA